MSISDMSPTPSHNHHQFKKITPSTQPSNQQFSKKIKSSPSEILVSDVSNVLTPCHNHHQFRSSRSINKIIPIPPHNHQQVQSSRVIQIIQIVTISNVGIRRRHPLEAIITNPDNQNINRIQQHLNHHWINTNPSHHKSLSKQSYLPPKSSAVQFQALQNHQQFQPCESGA